MTGLVLWGIGPLAAALAPSILVLIGGWSVVKALGMVLAIPASIGLPIASYPDEAQRGQAIVLLEDEAFPEEAAEEIARQVPNLEGLSQQAYVEGFQITLGVLVGILLLALLLASLIPRVETEAVTAKVTKELVADVSSKRL